MIGLVHFEEQRFGTLDQGLAHRRLHQPPAETGARITRLDADRQDFGLAGDGARQDETAKGRTERAVRLAGDKTEYRVLHQQRVNFAVGPGACKTLAVQRCRRKKVGFLQRKNVELGTASEVIGEAHLGLRSGNREAHLRLGVGASEI
ncbi:hypothetical protein D9M72_395580 [compost metagenome]